MRHFSVGLALLVAVLVSACEYWPRELKPLAASISEQTSGEATAWLLSGDMIVINVASSPFYEMTQAELETRVTEMALRAIGFAETPLESIIITFYESAVTEDPEEMREFVFLINEDRPVLQPYFDANATGPLTHDEINAAIDRLGDSVAADQKQCVLGEVEQGALAAGDPELLDPAGKYVEFLPSRGWAALDPYSRRLFLAAALTTRALFACASAAD